MFKKISTLVLCCLLVLSLVTVSVMAAENTKFTVTADKTSAKPGDTITVTVTVPEMTTKNVGIQLLYDEAFLSFVSGKCTLSGGMISTVDVPSAGKVSCAWVAMNAIAVKGKAFEVSFKVKDTVDFGTTVIAYQKAQAGGYDVTANDVTIKICDHNFGSWTSAGTSNHQRTCTKCGEAETGTHSWDAGKTTTAPTCVAEGVKTYTCSVCNGTKTETIAAIGHSYGTWGKNDSETHKKTCANCGDIQTETHKWDAGKVTTEPTCTENGVKTYTCSVCKDTKTETILAGGKHTYSNAADTACDKCGMARIVYTLSAEPKAARCGAELTLTINASEVKNCTNFGLTVNYDPAIFEYVSGTCDVAGMMGGMTEKEPGRLDCYWADQSGKTVSGKVFTIVLKVKDDAAVGQTVITTDKTQAAVNDKTIDGIAGDLTLDVVKYKPGDMNADDELTTQDAVYLLLSIMFGDEDYPIPAGMDLDMNDDGQVTTQDAVYLLLHVMFGAEDYPI